MEHDKTCFYPSQNQSQTVSDFALFDASFVSSLFFSERPCGELYFGKDAHPCDKLNFFSPSLPPWGFLLSLFLSLLCFLLRTLNSKEKTKQKNLRTFSFDRLGVCGGASITIKAHFFIITFIYDFCKQQPSTYLSTIYHHLSLSSRVNLVFT